jgi:integration host factor subunit beta
MTKSQLIARLVGKNEGLSVEDATLVVETIFQAMTEALSKGERIEIRGFGSFEIRKRNPRKARNPKTGAQVMVGEKKVPFFKVGKELRLRVKQSTEKKQQ